jgi:hypothetical protein
MGIIGIGSTSTPPCGSPYFGNAHSFEHYIIPINFGSFFCVCAALKKHNTTQMILKSVMLTFEGMMFFKSMHYAFEMPIVIFILFSHHIQ